MDDTETVSPASVAGAPSNLAAHFERMARRQPDALAVACPIGRDAEGKTRYRALSFRELDQLSSDVARGLHAAGVARGMRTALLVPPSVELFALAYALFKLGAVAVLIDPGIGRQHLKRCLDEAGPATFIGSSKAQAASVLLGWARRTIGLRVTVGRRLFWLGTTFDRVQTTGHEDRPMVSADTRSDEVAAILYTSGSTGPPKGAVYRHGNFVAQLGALAAMFDIRPGEIDLPTFPLFALFDPALGASAVLPDMDFTRPGEVNPENILEPIRRFAITSMFGSPALLDRVGRYGVEHEIALPSLRRVLSAGAPVAPAVLARFHQCLGPGAEIHTPYGATEALPVSSVSSTTILGETRVKTEAGAGVCVGHAAPDVDIRIIAIDDSAIASLKDARLLPVWEVGEIIVRGPVVTREYAERPRDTALAKIHDDLDPQGIWHRMGDLGYVDATGRLWFVGRKAHRVVTSRGTLYTIPCEAVFNTHPAVRRTALVGVKRGGDIEPILVVELEPGARNAGRGDLADELRAIGARHHHTRAIQVVLYHPAFPVDVRHNAKIFRERLALWAADQLGASQAAS